MIRTMVDLCLMFYQDNKATMCKSSTVDDIDKKIKRVKTWFLRLYIVDPWKIRLQYVIVKFISCPFSKSLG